MEERSKETRRKWIGNAIADARIVNREEIVSHKLYWRLITGGAEYGDPTTKRKEIFRLVRRVRKWARDRGELVPPLSVKTQLYHPTIPPHGFRDVIEEEYSDWLSRTRHEGDLP